MTLLQGFLDPADDYWVDDLYDMDDGQLRKEAERYKRLADKYEQVRDKKSLGDQRLSYQFAHIRHHEALKLLKARSE